MYKRITCKNYLDCKLIGILVLISNKILDDTKPKWYIAHFVHRYLGIVLDLYKKDNKPCSLDGLKNAFIDIIDSLKNGWQQATLIDNQDICFTESEEEWFLFTKKEENFDNEILLLIYHLLDKFSLNEKTRCYKSFHSDRDNKAIYIWVRKDAIDEVRNILDLKILL